MHYRRDKNQKGFTLMEAVVATAVFAFVISSVIGVYLSTFQLDRKTRAQRAVTQNARFILEHLAKEVRNGTINYSSYGSSVPSNPDLYILNQFNELERFYLSNQEVWVSKDGGAATKLTSGGVKVTNLKFKISPDRDPYTTAKVTNEQPHVTIILELTSNYGNGAVDVVKLNFQDTYATRSYPSRL